jgi:SAM-dependent methyltransferase
VRIVLALGMPGVPLSQEAPDGVGYSFTEEGTATADAIARVPSGIDKSRCVFEVGDACSLDVKRMGKFHVVHGANLLCRLPRPVDFLESLPELVVDGGFVVFVSPYSWLKQYTPKSHWLGGFTASDGATVMSFDTLKKHMTRLGFTLTEQDDVPFMIREHRRKFQWGCSHLTVWRKME